MQRWVIIWDLGGVLLRTEDRQPRQQLAERLGLSYAELDGLVFSSPSATEAGLGHISAEEHWENLCKLAGWSPQDLPVIQHAFWGGDRLDLGLVDYVRSLQRNYRTALLSNNWSNLRQLLSTRWGIADAFDELFISAELGLEKPDARIYQLVQEKMKMLPEQAIFIDDSRENISAAQAAGWTALLFSSAEQAATDLQNLLAGEVKPDRKGTL